MVDSPRAILGSRSTSAPMIIRLPRLTTRPVPKATPNANDITASTVKATNQEARVSMLVTAKSAAEPPTVACCSALAGVALRHALAWFRLRTERHDRITQPRLR
jgi:hypothetical protein